MVDLLTVPEAARQLRLGVSTVYLLVARGELPVIRFGSAVRIPAIELQRVIEARTAMPVET